MTALRRRRVDAVCAAIATAAIATLWLVQPRPLQDQPFPDSAETVDVTGHLFHGDGFVTTIYRGDPKPSRYPPGFALALAPFAFGRGELGDRLQRGARVYAASYVAIMTVAAWGLGGPFAGALAAVLAAASPFARTEASLIMSDALLAALTVGLLILIRSPSPQRIATAGLVSGAMLLIRLQSVVMIVALLIALQPRWWSRLLLSTAPGLAALAFYNYTVFGNPIQTGYGFWLPGLHPFAASYAVRIPQSLDGPWVVADALDGLLLRWACPCALGGPQASMSNLLLYPAVLAGLIWVYAPPLVTAIGVWHCWINRRRCDARFALSLGATSLLFFDLYFYQGTRFMAPTASLLVVFAAVHIVNLSRKWITHADTIRERDAEFATVRPSP